MNRPSRYSRWAWPAAALVIVLGGAAVAATPALTGTAKGPLWTERPASAPAPAPAAAPAWVEVAKAAKPAVVNVSVKRAEEALAPGSGPRGQRDLDEFFRRFFGERGSRPPGEGRGLGSGFIINPDGYIVTNSHVVESAAEVKVKLSDGRELPARIVGRDPKTDLAVLKVDATGLPTIALGESGALQVGEAVMAIGNPFGLEQTVTTGIVSAVGRVIGAGPYDDFIQTDASINPGNSGGPLIDARGRVVGINTAIFSRSGGSEGIGFAIPVNLAKTVITQLVEHGRVTRASLGVTIQPVTDALAKGFGLADGKGALVSGVSEGSPAARAGLLAGDVIVEFDGRPVARPEDLSRAVAGTALGRAVPLKVIRAGRSLPLTATLVKLDGPAERVAVGAPGKATLGLSVETLTAEQTRALGLAETRGVMGGVLVRAVRPDSKAAEAGIQPGDVIVEVDRKPVRSVAELQERLDGYKSGSPIVMLLRREQASLYVAVPAA